jgi:hypothetical protein
MVLDLGLINDLVTAKSGKVVRLAMAIYGDGDPGDTQWDSPHLISGTQNVEEKYNDELC